MEKTAGACSSSQLVCIIVGGSSPPNKEENKQQKKTPKSLFKWSGRRDSNPRPLPWQGSVLPLNYFRICRVSLLYMPKYIFQLFFKVLIKSVSSRLLCIFPAKRSFRIESNISPY